MRRGTLITLIVLFVVIIGVAIFQLFVAPTDAIECPGPVSSPNALPAQGQPQDCR